MGGKKPIADGSMLKSYYFSRLENKETTDVFKNIWWLTGTESPIIVHYIGDETRV